MKPSFGLAKWGLPTGATLSLQGDLELGKFVNSAPFLYLNARCVDRQATSESRRIYNDSISNLSVFSVDATLLFGWASILPTCYHHSDVSASELHLETLVSLQQLQMLLPALPQAQCA